MGLIDRVRRTLAVNAFPYIVLKTMFHLHIHTEAVSRRAFEWVRSAFHRRIRRDDRMGTSSIPIRFISHTPRKGEK